MKREKFLLDCTLRDGGYLNDWKFGHDNLISIFERVVSSGVDAIEVGFLDDRRAFDIHRSIMPDTASAEKIYGGLDRGKAMVVGMIDYGTCAIENLQPCKDSFLDGIRVIFKKEKMEPAMEYCRRVKELGYKVFAQMVSVSSYRDEDFEKICAMANEIQPYALSMVDTYGVLDPKALTHMIRVIDRHLDRRICLGFHAHNNFQLGYVNATTVLESGINRDILVDGTLYGMGKSAGNAPLELLGMYMNEHDGKNYQITEMQEAITTSILDFQKTSPWGYQLLYYIAASNKVHPDYVSYLMNKRTLSVTAINEILQRIPEADKLGKNQKLLEKLYMDYQKKECDDAADLERLASDLKDQKILILGPASSLATDSDKIQAYIDKHRPTIISINYIPDQFRSDYLFLTNTKRFLQAESKLHTMAGQRPKLIASSNLTRNEQEFSYVVNYSSIIDEEAEFPDNSMCMLIRVLLRIGCRKASLAGLDGYTPDSINYYDREKEYDFQKAKADSLNAYARAFFAEQREKMEITFVTPSLYEE